MPFILTTFEYMLEPIVENQSLKPYNTFGIDVPAKFFTHVKKTEQLQELMEWKRFRDENKLILGGGSNVLFTQKQNALVILNEIKGINIENEDENSWLISAGSGENWHEFVLFCINNNYGGLENLSLIPGSVGAGPMQNIGAYGVEIKDYFEWLDALHLATGEIHRFYNKDCHFGYRESIFKNKHKGEYIILKVAYRLPKKHKLNTGYGAIQQELERLQIDNPTIKDVSNAVIKIRQSKLPDPNKIGNSGSFFKNPIVSNQKVEELKSKFPNLAYYPIDDKHSKIAAGWLIDQDGWKGKTFGNYGVHKNQALVLVNYGGAEGKQILELSTKIIDSVKQKFGITLEREVNIS